ncbi:class I adenylate-forming enzyme family protein [Streptomyces sp. NPDC059063]|uniref:class I adenylate-forming enzyme family protein n=1 Tax=unclassified Streptomyces TaxID=2593676 RepID=UPI0036908C19
MPGLLVGEVLRSAARAAPRRAAVRLGERVLTFAELDAAADRAVGGLAARGVRRGDRVVCLAGTSLDALALFAGAARAGVVFVPVAPGAAATGIVRAARPRLLVTDAEQARCTAGPGVRQVVLPDLADAPGEPPRLSPEERDPHVVLYPTAGRPRGVVLSHRASVWRANAGCRPAPHGVLVCGLPSGHWAVWTTLLRQWRARGTVILPEHPDPSTICAAVREHRAERLVCAPATWQAVLDTAPHHLATLRLADTETAGPTVPPRLLEAVRTATPGARVRAFLSTPEAGDIAVLDHADVRARPGTCGVPAPDVDVRLAPGELWVRGPQLFDGYFRDKRATDAVLRDGWFRTGRAARRDEDGYLYLAER